MAKVNLTVDHVMKTTRFETPLKAEAALETLKWLEQGAPHKFDSLKGKFSFNVSEFFVRVIDGDGSEELYGDVFPNDCGTVCCIAGAIYSYMNKVNGSCPHQHQNASIEGTFGHSRELYELFYGFGGFEKKITPKEGAKVLRKYLETGNTPNWKAV